MRPAKQQLPAVVATWRSMITLAVVVAVALVIFWAWRDGLDPGDLVGGLVTGVLTFATLAALRRLRTA
jgi:cation transporter-like permease